MKKAIADGQSTPPADIRYMKKPESDSAPANNQNPAYEGLSTFDGERIP